MKHVKTKRVMKDTVCGYTRVHIKVVIYEVFIMIIQLNYCVRFLFDAISTQISRDEALEKA